MHILTLCGSLCLQNEAGRRFHVNQAVWDVMDYCEDVLKDHSFCVLPELALARCSKTSSKVSSDAASKASNKLVGRASSKAAEKDKEREKKEKEAGKFGFSVEGEIMTEKSAKATKCVTFLTGVADYALWTFGMSEESVAHHSLCESSYLFPIAKHSTCITRTATVRYMKLLSQTDIEGHIVAVESKRQLNTPGEIDAAIAQAAGECLVM